MATITVKNIPEDIYSKIKKQASKHRRSINSEIITIFENATRSHRLDPNVYLKEARVLREKTAHYTATESDLTTMKNDGRP